MIVVTSYDNPDIDGIACSIAYAEMLNASGKSAKATYAGDLGLETEFVKKQTGSFPVEKHSGAYESDAQFVLVDTADPNTINPAIPPEKVIEVFDHRPLVFLKKFRNAHATVDLVGACATLITELLQEREFTPSRTTATYLYSAIVSNTMNFKSPNTVERDKTAAQWLKNIAQLPDDYIARMFAAKSTINANNLYEALAQDMKVQNFKGKNVGIAQLEIVNVAQLVAKFKDAMDNALARIKTEEKLDYIMFHGVDVVEASSTFYTVDQESNVLFAKALDIPDLKLSIPYKAKEPTLRKRIFPMVEQAIQNP